MQFTKMHGAGNDYVYVNCFEQAVPKNLCQLAIAVSDRHRGIGSDGLILIGPSEQADARMQMFNADGSTAEMCGNGVRCVAKFVYEHGIVRNDRLHIETGNGIVETELQLSNGKVDEVRVNMGPPILTAAEIPTLLPGNPPVNTTLELAASATNAACELKVTCVSMGNPHCVTFVDCLSDEWVLGMGPRLERHATFPNRVNVEFAQIVSRKELRVRVWERGAGETEACGTGACAVAVAGVLAGVSDRNVLIRLPGGDLRLEWADSGDVFMAGPAVEVYSGHWPLA